MLVFETICLRFTDPRLHYNPVNSECSKRWPVTECYTEPPCGSSYLSLVERWDSTVEQVSLLPPFCLLISVHSDQIIEYGKISLVVYFFTSSMNDTASCVIFTKKDAANSELTNGKVVGRILFTEQSFRTVQLSR